MNPGGAITSPQCPKAAACGYSHPLPSAVSPSTRAYIPRCPAGSTAHCTDSLYPLGAHSGLHSRVLEVGVRRGVTRVLEREDRKTQVKGASQGRTKNGERLDGVNGW